MKSFAILVAALCFVLLLIVVLGALLPKRHVVSLNATYSQSPEQLFALVAGPQSWRPDIAHEETESDSGGRRLQRETDKRGRTVVYEVRVLQPSRELSRRITNQDLPYGGTWTYALQPIGSKTKLTIAEDGEVYNPVFRFVARFARGYTKTIRAYLIALGQAGGEAVTPNAEPRS